MKKIILIKFCLSLCMFVGISYNATAQLRNEDCNESPDWWDCDPEHSFTIPPAVIEGEGKPGDYGGWADPPPPPPLPPPPDFGGDHGPTGDNDSPSATFTITVTASPTEGGMVSGGGIYESGTNISISASPNDGFVFEKWVDQFGRSSIDLSINIVVATDYTCTAYFAASSSYTPCGQRDTVSKNIAITRAVNALKGYAASTLSGNVEVSQYNTTGPNGASWTQLYVGFYDHIFFPMPTGYNQYGWMFHTHTVNGIFVPSPWDIWALISQIYKLNGIADLYNFVYGMVNHQGTAYAMTISDPSQLQHFILDNDLYNMNSQWYKDLEKALIAADTNAQEEEKVFVSMLLNCGLSIMKGTNITPTNTDWQRIEYSKANDTVVTKPCN